MKTRGKKYVVAGDMFELGRASVQEHWDLGRLMGRFPFHKFYLTGKAMKHGYNAIQRSKVPVMYGSKDAIFNDLQSKLQRGDILLVKGSRGMKMEEIIDKLRK